MCRRQLDFDMRVTYAICIPLTYAEEAPSPSHGVASKIVDMLAAEKQKGEDKKNMNWRWCCRSTSAAYMTLGNLPALARQVALLLLRKLKRLKALVSLHSR